MRWKDDKEKYAAKDRTRDAQNRLELDTVERKIYIHIKMMSADWNRPMLDNGLNSLMKQICLALLIGNFKITFLFSYYFILISQMQEKMGNKDF